MSEGPDSRRGLESFLGASRHPRPMRCGVTASIPSNPGYVNLRGEPGDETWAGGVAEVLGQPLPVEPNTLTVQEHVVCWLGPDEFLVRTAESRVAPIIDSLEGLPGRQSVNDLSGGLCTLQLGGEDVRALLAKGCTLDLHPRAFGPGRCAQTGLAKANVLLACIRDESDIDVVVRRSFADYVSRWLLHSGGEYGIRFETL